MADEPSRVLTITRGATVLDIAHRLLLASVGAVVLAQEEIEVVIERLVERGEIAERDGRRLLKEILDQRRDSRLSSLEHLHPYSTSETGLGELTLASIEQVSELGEKINVISARIDRLIEEQKTVAFPDDKELS